MSTNPESVNAAIDQLRQQLTQIDKLDPSLREQLNQSLSEIQAALKDSATPGDSSQAPLVKRDSLLQRLRETANRFEASHPILSENIGGLIDALSSSGI